MASSRARNFVVVGVLGVVGAGLFAFPFVYHSTRGDKRLVDSDMPLSANQMRRGMYSTTGKDIGPDKEYRSQKLSKRKAELLEDKRA